MATPQIPIAFYSRNGSKETFAHAVAQGKRIAQLADRIAEPTTASA